MIPFDLILIVTLIVFMVWGAYKGLVGALGYVLGFIFGVTLSSRYYPLLSKPLQSFFENTNPEIINVISFLIILGLISKIISFVLDLIFKVVSFIPFVKTINRLIGAGIGLIGGIVVIGSLIYMFSRYPFSSFIASSLPESVIAPILLTLFTPITFFFPEILKQLKSLI